MGCFYSSSISPKGLTYFFSGDFCCPPPIQFFSNELLLGILLNGFFWITLLDLKGGLILLRFFQSIPAKNGCFFSALKSLPLPGGPAPKRFNGSFSKKLVTRSLASVSKSSGNQYSTFIIYWKVCHSQLALNGKSPQTI